MGKLRVYRTSYASWYGPGLYGNRTACGQTLGYGTLGVAHDEHSGLRGRARGDQDTEEDGGRQMSHRDSLDGVYGIGLHHD